MKFTKDDGNILISVRTVESSNNIHHAYSESIKQKADKTVIVSVKDRGRYRPRDFSQFIQEIYIKIISGHGIRVVYL